MLFPNAQLAGVYDIKNHILNCSKVTTARELKNRSIGWWWKEREGGWSTVVLTSLLTQHSNQPKKKKKKASEPCTARAFYCSNPPPLPLPRPLSHQPHVAGQPISWSRGLKAPAGRATIGLLQPWKGKCSLLSLTFFLSNSLSLCFAVGRHYGSHYSGPPSCHRSFGALTWPCVCECMRTHKPRRTSSSPTKCEMRRIKSHFSWLFFLLRSYATHFTFLLDTFWCTHTHAHT